jgi:hypothetical protein
VNVVRLFASDSRGFDFNDDRQLIGRSCETPNVREEVDDNRRHARPKTERHVPRGPSKYKVGYPVGDAHPVELAVPSGPSTAFIKLWAVILLSLPTIVGTGFFLAGVIVSEIFGLGDAPEDLFREPTSVERAKMAVAFAIFLMCYFGATFGPLLLPLAAWQAFELTRVVGVRSRVAICAWTFVVVGLIACALFWGWLINLDIFI